MDAVVRGHTVHAHRAALIGDVIIEAMFVRLFQGIVAVLIAVLGTTASAASFDCKAAASGIEAMICANPGASQQDELLATAYAQLKKRAGNEQSEKTTQLAWLKLRNTCADVACLQRTYTTRIAELQARLANASPLVGFWKKEYSCAGATDLYAARCKQGDRDVFVLAIQVQGEHVCITHVATAQLGNRIDAVEGRQPSMTGTATGNIATVAFESTWGGKGTATLQADANVLRWKVRSKDDGETWIPAEETLARIPADPYSQLPACRA